MKKCKRHKAAMPCHKCRDIERLAALKRDALRYRHIREGFYLMGNSAGLGYVMHVGRVAEDSTPEQQLARIEAALDAEIRRGE